jgi:hypothetical protein
MIPSGLTGGSSLGFQVKDWGVSVAECFLSMRIALIPTAFGPATSMRGVSPTKTTSEALTSKASKAFVKIWGARLTFVYGSRNQNQVKKLLQVKFFKQIVNAFWDGKI